MLNHIISINYVGTTANMVKKPLVHYLFNYRRDLPKRCLSWVFFFIYRRFKTNVGVLEGVVIDLKLRM